MAKKFRVAKIFRKRIGWLVDDLQRNDISQTHGRLYDPDTAGFCCLGRACEVFRANTGRGRWEFLTDTNHNGKEIPGSAEYQFVVEDRDGNRWNSTTDLPKPVYEWFGFNLPSRGVSAHPWDPDLDTGEKGSPIVIDGRHSRNRLYASAANDDLGLSFKRIAVGFRKWWIDKQEKEVL